MKHFFFISLLIIAIAIVGCTTNETTPTGEVVLEEQSTTSVSVNHKTEQTKIVEHEVFLKKEGFFPATFNAQEGEILRLIFELDEPHFITIEDLGISEMIQQAVLEFTPKKGEYDMMCSDCATPFVAVIMVQ